MSILEDARSFDPSDSFEYLAPAGFWRRCSALIVDFAIIEFFYASFAFVVLYLCEVSLSELSGQFFPKPDLNTQSRELALFYSLLRDLGVWIFIYLFFGWLYFALFESSALSTTPGKMMFGLQVRSRVENRMSFSRASLRHFAKFFSFMSLGIGFLFAGVSIKKQALHDMISNCLVLRERNLSTVFVLSLLITTVFFLSVVHSSVGRGSEIAAIDIPAKLTRACSKGDCTRYVEYDMLSRLQRMKGNGGVFNSRRDSKSGNGWRMIGKDDLKRNSKLKKDKSFSFSYRGRKE